MPDFRLSCDQILELPTESVLLLLTVTREGLEPYQESYGMGGNSRISTPWDRCSVVGAGLGVPDTHITDNLWVLAVA
jgi:hypothetical protein